MPKLPWGANPKETLDEAIKKYWEEVLKRMPPEKREEILKEIEQGRKIVVPPPQPRE